MCSFFVPLWTGAPRFVLLSAFVSALLLTGPLPLSAQDRPARWGDIPPDDLRMTDFPADSNATALILADYGEVEVDEQGLLTYTHHRRVKLFSEAAYDDWGTVDLLYYDGEIPERISNLEAQTFTLGPDGKSKRHKLDRKAFYDEDVDGTLKRIRFTFSALEPGAVVEFRYTMRTENPSILPKWTFQHDEPTRWSEYRATNSRRFAYARVSRSWAFDIEEEKELTRPNGKAVLKRWVMQDVPALREEPYITTLDDYRPTVELQLAEYYIPGQGVNSFFKTWDELADELRSHAAFGRRLGRHRAVRRQAEALTAGLSEPSARLNALFTFVQSTLQWNGYHRYVLEHDLDDVLTSKTGSSAEINLLLVALLRAAGLDADPVLLSTRQHGAVRPGYPLLSQFNYVVAHVLLDGRSMLLDATDPYCPPDLLPVRALNRTGWLLRDVSADWIVIEPPARYTRQVSVKGTLDPSGTLTATLQSSDNGYSALIQRQALAESSPDAFVRQVLLGGMEGVELASSRVTGADSLDGQLKAEVQATLPGYGQAAGTFLYVNPFVVERMRENPLRLPERTFPVDLAYPMMTVYSTHIELPEGYDVVELPKGLNLRLPEKGGSFVCSFTLNQGVLIVQSRLTLARTVYQPNEYGALREFFDRVVATQAEPVVLKQSTE